MNTIGNVFSGTTASAQDSGLSTIAAASQRLSVDAQQIADPGGTDVTNALLDLSQTELITQAGADVIRTANKMLGTLLDVLA